MLNASTFEARHYDPGVGRFFRHGCLLGKHDSDSDRRQRMYKYQYILLCYLCFYVRRKQKNVSKNHKELLSHALARSFRKSLDLFIRQSSKQVSILEPVKDSPNRSCRHLLQCLSWEMNMSRTHIFKPHPAPPCALLRHTCTHFGTANMRQNQLKQISTTNSQHF